MSKEFKNIDDLFQSAFSHESAEVPAFVKEKIDKKIGLAKPKKGWIWLAGTALVAFLTAATFLILNQTEAANESSLITSTISAENTTTPASAETPITSASAETNHTTNQINLNTSNTDTHINNQPELTRTSTSDQTGVSPVSSQTKNNKNNNIQGTNGQVKTEKNQNETGSTGNQKNSSSLFGSFKQQQKSGALTAKNDENTFENGVLKNDESTLTETDQTISSSNLFYARKAPVSLASRMFEQNTNQPSVASTGKPFSVSIPDQFPFTSNHKLADANSIERGEHYNPWMISGTAGVNFTQSRYTFTTPAEEQYYVNSTYPVPGFEGNLDVKYRLKNSLTFGTGAGISQLVENYNFFKQSYEVDSTLTWSYEYDSTDTLQEFPIDSSYTVTTDSSLITLYNNDGTSKATYLQIPFSIGTQLIYKKFRFDLYVMGRFNYLLNARGGYLQNDVFTAFSKNQNQIFKTWYLDLMLGTAIHYELSEKIFLTGTFRFHPALGEIYENLNFNRKIQSYHVGIGLSWKL